MTFPPDGQEIPSGLHSGVQAAFYLAVCVLTMSAFHPVLVAISFFAGVACSMLQRGVRNTLSSFAWQLPLVLLICVANPLFSASGSTELLRVGVVVVYSESLAYGACMGLLFVSTLLWLGCAFRVLTFDKIMALTGNAAPTVTLMLSMTGRLVPELVRRGKLVSDVQEACTAAHAEAGRKNRLKRTRLMSVLVGWSLEDSLETADTMRARGWSRYRKRSVYRRRAFRRRDAMALFFVVALAVLDVVVAVQMVSSFSFYPTMAPLVFDLRYVLYALLFALPSLVMLWRAWEWK